MQRRGGSEQPEKGQRRSAIRPKARKASTAQVSTADLQEQLDLRTRERDEALEQLAATSDVLQVISRSAFDLKSVLQTLVESAARLCKADKAAITRQIGGEFFFTETYGLSPEFIEHVKTVPVKPERGTVSGLVLLEGRTVHVPDVRVPRDPAWARLRSYAASVACSAFRCCAMAPPSAFWPWCVRRHNHSPISRSSWSRILPIKPSSPSRTRGCSTNCASAPMI
jgi:GAF domain